MTLTLEVEILDAIIVRRPDDEVRLAGAVEGHTAESAALDVDSFDPHEVTISTFTHVEHAGELIETAAYYTINDEEAARTLAAAIIKPWEIDS